MRYILMLFLIFYKSTLNGQIFECKTNDTLYKINILTNRTFTLEEYYQNELINSNYGTWTKTEIEDTTWNYIYEKYKFKFSTGKLNEANCIWHNGTGLSSLYFKHESNFPDFSFEEIPPIH